MYWVCCCSCWMIQPRCQDHCLRICNCEIAVESRPWRPTNVALLHICVFQRNSSLSGSTRGVYQVSDRRSSPSTGYVNTMLPLLFPWHLKCSVNHRWLREKKKFPFLRGMCCLSVYLFEKKKCSGFFDPAGDFWGFLLSREFSALHLSNLMRVMKHSLTVLWK